MLNYYDSLGIDWLLCFDQLDALVKIDYLKSAETIKDIFTCFNDRIIYSVSNTNLAMKNRTIERVGNELNISSQDIVANSEEVAEYCKKLHLFEDQSEQLKANSDFMNKLEILTKFNPFEIQVFHKVYEEMKESKKNITSEKIEEIFVETRNYQINTSHSNFQREYLSTSRQKEKFLKCLNFMDSDKEFPASEMILLIDNNLMEFNKVTKKITSICPMGAKYLEKEYNLLKLAKKEPETREFYKAILYEKYRICHIERKGYLFKEVLDLFVFEKCVLKQSLLKGTEIHSVAYNVRNAIEYIDDDLIKTIKREVICKDIFFFLNNPYFDFIDMIFLQKDGKKPVLNKNILIIVFYSLIFFFSL